MMHLSSMWHRLSVRFQARVCCYIIKRSSSRMLSRPPSVCSTPPEVHKPCMIMMHLSSMRHRLPVRFQVRFQARVGHAITLSRDARPPLRLQHPPLHQHASASLHARPSSALGAVAATRSHAGGSTRASAPATGQGQFLAMQKKHQHLRFKQPEFHGTRREQLRWR